MQKRQRPSPWAACNQAGFFATGCTLWMVDREALLVLGVGRALLLQLAHPLVAAGVADHSDFQGDFFGRLAQTLDTLNTLVFGDREAAMVPVQRLDAIHQRVGGVIRKPVGAVAASIPYEAADPALRLWIQATLIDTKLLVYDRFIRRLAAAEQAAYYADARALARRLGIPEPLVPPTLEAFRRYMAGMLACEHIAVRATTRTLTHMVFHLSSAMHHHPIGAVVQFVTVGLLPPKIRDQYGYRWSPVYERALRAVAVAVRRAVPVLPRGSASSPMRERRNDNADADPRHSRHAKTPTAISAAA
jgi:uncharacterized protein (DUF2236 family)